MFRLGLADEKGLGPGEMDLWVGALAALAMDLASPWCGSEPAVPPVYYSPVPSSGLCRLHTHTLVHINSY